MQKYIVKNKNTNLYLDDGFYHKSKGSNKLKNAHRFSAFELLLASKTVLINRERYIVYNYQKLLDSINRITLIDDLYEVINK